MNSLDPITPIYPTNNKKEVYLSPANALKATELYHECCKKIAEYISCNSDKFGNINYEELTNLIPEPEFKIKSNQKKKKILIEDWKTTDSIDKLSTLSVDDLKKILSENSLSLSGNKRQLSNRVLAIHYPNKAEPETKSKKKGRPKKNIKSEIMALKQESLDELLTNTKKIYIDSDGKMINDDDKASTQTFVLIEKKNGYLRI